MHEINAAAETITAAADPDANIIFGATISPDLDGEVIITVVATGFDDSYYAKRGEVIANDRLSSSTLTASKKDEQALSEIDMEINDDEAPDFTKEDDSHLPNIWSMSEDHDDDEPVSDKSKDDDHNDDGTALSSEQEADLEKPSFLRRLGRRKKNKSQDNMFDKDIDEDHESKDKSQETSDSNSKDDDKDDK
jgi:hypothetical protein